MLNILYRRRSIRRYRDTEVEPEKIDQLVQAALLSPSSRGLRHLEFMVLDDRKVLAQLAPAKQGAEHLKGSAAAIVILADPAVSDVWVEDASIAATIIHLTAESLGLGSCWIQIRERKHSEAETAEQYVQKVLGIPSHLRVETIISLGYPSENKQPHTYNDLDFNKVHRNQYGEKYLFSRE
ncbi:nitroreductase family protein [Desulfitobacterium sp. AusDCA]|uniref:nitroreductase family protein n=1 Tax=Desulfitobacterium sp. AusDCA TaxID=3240383 RepID=UPI003DA79824